MIGDRHTVIKARELRTFQNYVVFKDISELRLARVLDNELGLPWSVHVGVCGLAGHTAHHAWMKFAKPKRNDVVFVTTGAGPVDIRTVIQLAKQAGCKGIVSAGSEEKVNFLRSIGTDVAFNYKMQNTFGVLLKEGPIDIYWDNVGGESLEAADGTLGSYSETGTYAVKNLPLIVKKSLALHGLTVMDFHDKYAEQYYAEFPRMVREGMIRYTEDVSIGLESVGEAILDVQMGRNKGKKAIIVSQE
ncbi:NAD(P)-binding protein [Daedalea quercina L-15889]|uniref:NAD(P)-binding protein n=1 Tax=Daedalea quercina L-15889 TaxID=1314783 RepID=A0A165M5D9_9APHY|nr:NAD(P)-binding protein [Daedalea quercina L-15889]